MNAQERRGALPRLSVAPMMDWTDRHCRVFLRQVTRRTLLYTEMVTTGAILHGDREHLLGFSAVERPLALQLGGDDPAALAECARIAEGMGYDEVDLNVGCPSDRVQQGRFGACLMAHPDLVARAVAAMRAATPLPVTVKHRIGVRPSHLTLTRKCQVGGSDPIYDELVGFVRTVAGAGVDRLVVHARIAILKGLTPKENRHVPPLRYDDVYRLKAEHPDIAIEINGGVRTMDDVLGHLGHVDGVMVGRAAYTDPFAFATADRLVFGDERPPPTREGVVAALLEYADRLAAAGQPAHRLTRHMLGLFARQPGGRAWRRTLSEGTKNGRKGASLLREALRALGSGTVGSDPYPCLGAGVAGPSHLELLENTRTERSEATPMSGAGGADRGAKRRDHCGYSGPRKPEDDDTSER